MQKESGINKLVSYLRNFFYNGFSLFKALCTTKNIYWSWNLSNLDNCKIDSRAILNKPYSLRGAKIGAGTAIGPNSRIAESVIGKYCSIGPNFLCGWGIHPINGISTSPVFYSTKGQAGFSMSQSDKVPEHKPVNIGSDVFIGANVTILDGVAIGHGAVIGAGAVVSKDIPPYAIAIGCPIRIIKYRFSEETIEKLLMIKWWDKNDHTLQKVEQYFFDVNTFIEEMLPEQIVSTEKTVQ